MHPSVESFLSPELIVDITEIPIENLRRLRGQCSQAEGDVSFVRRVVQGRLDIIGHEIQRRAGQGVSGPLADDDLGPQVLFDLPDILTTGGATPLGNQRHLAAHEPGVVALDLGREVDQIVPVDELSGLSGLDGPRLAELRRGLQDYESALSELRHRLHQRIDLIQGEVGRRYREGEASVDSLLG